MSPIVVAVGCLALAAVYARYGFNTLFFTVFACFTILPATLNCRGGIRFITLPAALPTLLATLLALDRVLTLGALFDKPLVAVANDRVITGELRVSAFDAIDNTLPIAPAPGPPPL